MTRRFVPSAAAVPALTGPAALSAGWCWGLRCIPRKTARMAEAGLIVWVLFIIFLATVIRSAFGFGEALVAVPLLALFIPVEIFTPSRFVQERQQSVGVLDTIELGLGSTAPPWRVSEIVSCKGSPRRPNQASSRHHGIPSTRTLLANDGRSRKRLRRSNDCRPSCRVCTSLPIFYSRRRSAALRRSSSRRFPKAVAVPPSRTCSRFHCSTIRVRAS